MRTIAMILVIANVAAAGTFVLGGDIRDFLRKRREQRLDQVQRQLVALLMDPTPPTPAQVRAHHDTPRRILLGSLQSLAYDVEGTAFERALQLVDSFGLDRDIRRLSRSRKWRKRMRASQLLHLLPASSSVQRTLLRDPHPMVRAYAVAGLTSDALHRWYDLVLVALDAPERPVHQAAQSALIRSEPQSLHLLEAYLADQSRAGTQRALEVASRIPDPGVQAMLNARLGAADASTRVLVARGLGLSATRAAGQILGILLTDDSEAVRAQAAISTGYIGATSHAPTLGALLGDRSWDVRRSAGLALDQLGPVGTLVLRRSLTAEDPFARDMARQVLHAAAVRLRQPPPLDAEDLFELGAEVAA